MSKHIVHVWLLAAIGAAAAGASTLTLGNGALSGLPDSTIGWGFTIQSTPILDGNTVITPWLLITFADFVPDSGFNPVGVFTPFITQLPNSNTVIGPNAGNGEINPWSQTFDNSLMTGIGSYHINNFQINGDQVFGKVVLFYDVYRASPNSGSFDPAADTVAVGQIMSAPASVTVTPEPGTMLLMAFAGCGLAGWVWHRKGNRHEWTLTEA